MSFSQALRAELRPRDIHVMAVAPGWIKTEFFDHAVHDNHENMVQAAGQEVGLMACS